jgi:hypothetical protein
LIALVLAVQRFILQAWAQRLPGGGGAVQPENRRP